MVKNGSNIVINKTFLCSATYVISGTASDSKLFSLAGNKLCTPGEVSELKTIQFVEHQLIFFDTQKDGVLEQELPVAHAKLKALEEKVKATKDNQAKTEEREKSKELQRRQSSCFKLNLDNVTT